ncbi:flagellar hook-associated protein FlgL [Alicyclobacillus dauci]|uniref:Flagellar hook-associated protein FlgL n=1 Tax=Alicyclobacillus dauci TaxID=1475485 RepID=A0ABY6Z5U5_9BACL|nr:flagellar hook-associated protein FlgL [Alicyclobacillus dauci]WAH37686.1 flagellar hook-associated protein FlgL [Alicyclobacillus dauci]
MRVTQGMVSSQVLFDIESNYQRLSTYQNEAATGKKINTPSDDPIGVQFAMKYQNQLAYYNQYQQNADQATSQLNYTDSTMSEAQTVMQRARDLAVQGANGTYTQSDMASMASEVSQLYQQLVSVGNSQYNGSYIFDVTSTTTPPYTSGTAQATTTGGGTVVYDVGDGVTLQASETGTNFFGVANAPNNAFQLLSDLQTYLQSGNSAQVQQTLSNFDSCMANMSAYQANIGALTQRAQMMSNRMSNLAQNVTTQLANTQDADMASVITQMNSALAVQQASLSVGAKAIVPTLVNFLN